MPTLGASLLVGTTNLYDLGASANRIRKVWSGAGDFSTSLQVGTNLVATSPDSGNALQWRANGFYMAAGAVGDLFNPVVRDTIQFAPAPTGAVDTNLWRAAGGVLVLRQPGADGAAANGAQYNIMARSGPGGTAGPASLVWGVDSGIRWLMQQTPNNGPLVMYDYGADGATFLERLRFEHLSFARFNGTGGTGMPGWVAVSNPTSTSYAWFGQAVPGGVPANASRLDIAGGAYYNGSAWILQEPTQPATVMSFMPAANNWNSPLVGVWDYDTAGGATLQERFILTRAGHLGLGVGAGGGVQALSAHATNKIVLLGGTGIFEANGTAGFVSIAENFYFHSDNTGHTIQNKKGSYLQQHDGNLTFAQIPASNPATTAGGATVRFAIDANTGTSSFWTGGADYAIIAHNNIRLNPGPSNLSGIWHTSPDNVNRAFVGMESASSTLWRIYSVARGNIVSVALDTGAVTFQNNISINNTVTSAGQLMLYSSAGGNVQIGAVGGYMHPHGDNIVHLGHAGIRWANFYAAGTANVGEVIINPGNITAYGGIVRAGNPGSWYCDHMYYALVAYYGARFAIQNSAHAGFSIQPSPGAELLVIENSSQGLFCGAATLVCDWGRSDRRFVTVYCQQVNQSCTEKVKENISDVDHQELLDDLLHTPVVNFKYKDRDPSVLPERMIDESDPQPMQIGIIAERTPARLLSSPDGASPMAIASAAVGGVQALHAKLEAALERIALLEERLA